MLATLDPRAIARYRRTGLDALVPMIGLHGVPRNAPLTTDLVREPIDAAALPIKILPGTTARSSTFGGISTMPGSPASGRASCTVAMGGRSGMAITPLGPVGAVLCGARPGRPSGPPGRRRGRGGRGGHDNVTFDLPLTARAGLDHLLARGLQVDPFVMLFFTDGPTDGLDRSCLTSPPFFA